MFPYKLKGLPSHTCSTTQGIDMPTSMAEDSPAHQMDWEEEVDHEIDRLAAATDFGQAVLQGDVNSAAQLGIADVEAEIDNEIERLIREAEEVDNDIDRLIADAEFDSENTLNPDVLRAVNTGLDYVKCLPVVPVSDLPEKLDTCPICKEAFGNTENSELPVRLPCQHVFGSLCISKWIYRNTCPLCRAPLCGPEAANALAQDGEAREGSLPTPPLLLQTPQAPIPLAFEHGDGAEENIGRFDVRVRELAGERRRLVEYRISRGAQNGEASVRLGSGDSIVTQFEVRLRPNVALTHTQWEERIRSRLRV